MENDQTEQNSQAAENENNMPENHNPTQPNEPYGTISEDLYLAFIGKNVNYFSDRFKLFAMQGGGFIVNWNWAAFFFPCIWLFYRKMYLYGLIALITSLVVPGLSWIITGLIVGLFGNSLYFLYAKTKLTQIQNTLPKDKHIQAANLAGGTLTNAGDAFIQKQNTPYQAQDNTTQGQGTYNQTQHIYTNNFTQNNSIIRKFMRTTFPPIIDISFILSFVSLLFVSISTNYRAGSAYYSTSFNIENFLLYLGGGSIAIILLFGFIYILLDIRDSLQKGQ